MDFRIVFSVSIVAAITSGCGESNAPSATGAGIPVACEDLASLRIADTTIRSAETVAAGAFVSPGPDVPGPPADYARLPEFCRVAGSISPTADSDIRFELWLPADNWNGRYMQTGNGGAAGVIIYASLAEPLSRGYAVANTDTGHRGSGGDFSWAAGKPEQLVDYQYRAVRELTVAGKTITAVRYGKAPERSYWLGCSTGGRQGLLEAQRYPADYDAIIAGAPANNFMPLMALSIHIQNNLGPDGIGVDKVALLKEGAIAACDAADGVMDRVITEPDKCGFDPASIECHEGQSGQCLEPGEVLAARRIYAGVVGTDGRVLMPGTGRGSEPVWAWYASPQFTIGASYFRHVVFDDARWDPAGFDVETTLARAERADGGAMGAMDPDLAAFIGHGGKLILYHGATDGLIPYGNTVNYYESVVGELGEDAVRDSVRFYLVPGMDHCAGGDGAFIVDWLSAMEDWVERGQAPGVLDAAHPALVPGARGLPPLQSHPYSRPLCPYPLVATYNGRGDTADAANFECRAAD